MTVDNESSETADLDDDKQDEIGMANEKEEKSVNEKKPVLIKREIVQIEDSPPAPKRARGNDIERAEAKKRQEILLKLRARKNNTAPAKTPAKSPTTKPSLSMEEAIESALIRHRDSVFKLLARSAAHGEQVVPRDLIFSARNTTQTQLEFLSSLLKRHISETELSVKIGNAESAAVKQFTEHIRQNMHKKP